MIRTHTTPTITRLEPGQKPSLDTKGWVILIPAA